MDRAIVAVDPGKVTGVAVYYPETTRCTTWEKPCWEAVRAVHRGLERGRISHLVVEAFTISMRTLKLTRGENWSLESIGALRYLASLVPDLEEFHVQPVEAKNFGTDRKLRALGWYHPTPGGHRNDAARHLIAFIAARKLDPELIAALAMVTKLEVH